MKKYLLLLLLIPSLSWGAADTTKVYGIVHYADGQACMGATVTITMDCPNNLVDTTSATDTVIIIAVMPMTAGDSDTLGYWSQGLVPSLDFGDTVLYNFEGSWGMKFDGLFLIDADSLNLGDSIAGR